MSREVMVSTKDNPYDYFTQFDQWNAFDIDKGYCSCSLVARIAKLSDELSEADELEEVEHAVDQIIKEDVLCQYKKVVGPGGGPA